MKSEAPAILRIGGSLMILPHANHRLPVDVQADLATTMLLEPEPSLLAEWISRMEAKLGVTDQHRQLLADRAVSAVGSREDKRRRLLDEHRRASQIGAPLRDLDQLAKIDAKALAVEQARVHAEHAAAEAGAADAKRRKVCRRNLKAARGRLAKLEADLLKLRTDEQAGRELRGEANDPILMARARGDDVIAGERETAEVARDQYGARMLRDDGLPVLTYGRGLRAKRLTGIHHAYANGYLGAGMAAERHYNTGRLYREAYEIAEGQKCSGGEGGGGFGPKAPQPRVVEAGQALADMRHGLSLRQRQVLDLVCGKDMRAREAADLLNAGFPATQRALRGGLEAARARLAASKAKGDGARHARRVRFATILLADYR